MTPSADERARARRRLLLQRHLLVLARRSEQAQPAAVTRPARSDGSDAVRSTPPER